VKNKLFNSAKIALLASTVLYSTSSLAGERINKIIVKGNKRVEVSTVESYLGFKVGDEYNNQKQNGALQSLYATSLFDNINIKFDGSNVIVDVKETPFVSKVEFSGNSKIKSSTLLKDVLTKSGESLSRAKIELDLEKIKELYKRSGRFSIKVETKIEEQENSRVKVIFKITEGPKTGIKNIYFVGNDSYKDSELRSIILTRESRWFRFLETNDAYDPDRIEYDKELLKEFYNSVGYADFRVISATAELSQTKEYFTVTYSVEEGEKYNLGNISIENKLQDIDLGQISSHITVKSGEIFNMKAIDKIAEKMSDVLSNKGYPQLAVYPETFNNSQTKLVDVKFVIDKADKIFVRKINIEGNVKTEDKVIRRAFRLSEGDIFNRSYIEKAQHNLRNLDYFEKVSVNMLPTNVKDRYDINVQVEEKSTSSIGLDLGYNTSGGLFTRISFLERNLVGTGKYLTLGAQVARKSNNYYFGVTDPHFLDKDLSLGVNLFRSQSGRSSGFLQAEQSYSIKSLGASTTLGYDIAEDLNHSIDYTIKRDQLNAPAGSSARLIQEERGSFVTSAIGHTITYDRTDSRIIPKNGYLTSFTQEYAGLGGNNKYLKHEVEGKYFKSFVNNKITFKLSGSAGDIRKMSKRGVRISDRFNLGDYTLRGFAFGGIGPRDKTTDEGLGGMHFYSASAELNFPVGAPEEFNLSGAAFCDIGSVWDIDIKPGSNYSKSDFYNDKSMRASVGFGIIWITRIAPIRVDWAVPIKKKPYDDKQNLHIKFSTHF
jgi:outer membrane protein insertion porin family